MCQVRCGICVCRVDTRWGCCQANLKEATRQRCCPHHRCGSFGRRSVMWGACSLSPSCHLLRGGCTSDTKTLSLVLTLVLRLGEFDGNIGHVIPGVVDTDEQQQHRSRGDDEQCRCRIAWEQKRCDEEGGVGDERKDRMPEPVFQYRLI